MPQPKIEYLDTWIDGKSVGRKPNLGGERLPDRVQPRQDNGTLWKDDKPAPKHQTNIVNHGTINIFNK
jgi:hypothetical protein